MELLILAIFCSAILGGLLGYLIYKNQENFERIREYTEQQENKRSQKGTNKHF